MVDTAVIMATEHTTVHAKIHTRAKTAWKVSIFYIKYSYMNLLFSVKTFDLLCKSLRGGSMIRDQKIILKVQTTIVIALKLTGFVYCLCPNNQFVVT